MRFSIVTPSFNRASMIAAAIDSVAAQDHPPHEHLVMDGGSTDGTLDVLRGYPQLTVHSAPDKGLYDAINKGIARATGDVIGLVNSDDLLLPGALTAVAATLAADPDADAVCGDVLIGPVGNPGPTDRRVGCAAMRALRPGDVISGLVLTNARFFRRHVFERLGPFDQTHPTLADREFLARFLLAGMRTAAIDRPLYRYGVHSGSLTFHGGDAGTEQLREALSLTETALLRAEDRRTRRFYCLWHGWTAGYGTARCLIAGRITEALRFAARASGAAPLWPIRFVRSAIWHLATRRQRHGHPVGPAKG